MNNWNQIKTKAEKDKQLVAESKYKQSGLENCANGEQKKDFKPREQLNEVI